MSAIPREQGGALVDRLATLYAEPPFAEEIERARQEHDRLRGRIFDDDELYAQYMASFLEWYVIERALPCGCTPVVDALARGAVVDEADRALARALARSYHSLFEVQRLLPDALLLDDLIRGGRWRVLWLPAAGVERGDLLEARLVPWQGSVCLGPVMLFHPREARRQIHLLLASWRASAGSLGPEVIWWLAEMRLRFARFRNIAVEHIYRLDRAAHPAEDLEPAGCA